MQTHNPSRTAQAVAALRALESQKPAEQRVCYDPFAEKFVGKPVLETIADRLARSEPMVNANYGYIVARTRHIDEILKACLENRLEQLVVLGAGYDSRAYRFDQLKEHTTVFEVDHLATQQAKTRILTDVLGGLPDHVRLVPMDFMTDSLPDQLEANGYDANRYTLFIWEGVTPYMTADAVDATLAFVAKKSRRGSSIVFDYTRASIINGTASRPDGKLTLQGAAQLGEVFQFGIEDGMIEPFLIQRGFTQVRNANNHDLRNLYFHGINRRREISSVFEIVHATVA